MRTRTKKDFKENWQQTVTAILALVATLLVSFGLITAEQASEGLPLANAIVTGIGGVIAAVTAIIGIFFKPSTE